VAITYKSQGAGASTETSGAALSPLCPATVDAGDILIAHVFWESNVTAPNTPGGWTLLSGPILIETTVARHWVFGKIADGTEDGAAVAFGSPAVTTQRGARVYSFAGRVAGTITELVTGFATTSHATDPQMPSVTTTIAGALAVALVGQNDNNAFASPTGESGGDWVEAVAEYTVALTPGMSLGIETATPTADPGTISGGAMATTNDPCGVIGFQIKQSANQSVTPGIVALTITRFAPSVVLGTVVTPGTLALVLTAFAPTVTVAAGNVVVTPGTATVTITRFAPTVTASDNKTVTPGTAVLTLTTFAPDVRLGIKVTAGTAVLVTVGFAPTVTVSNNVVVTPGTLALTITRFAPAAIIFDPCGPPFLYTAANWTGVDFFLEVYFRATTGTVYAQLIDNTNAVPVGSRISTAASTFTRVRSGAVSLVDGRAYRVQFGKEGADAGEFTSAKLVAVP